MSVVISKEPVDKPAPPSVLKSVAGGYLDRIRGGDTGALPALLALAVLVVAFSIMRPVFFSYGNFANLLTQGAAVVVIAMGLIFVLLLGEIDLSAGYTSGVCAAVMAILLTNHGWPWYASIGIALLCGAVIGTLLGSIVVKIGVPSFVVTLAAFLAFQGIALKLLNNGTNVSIRDDAILAIENKNLSPLLGWVCLAILIVIYAAVQFKQARSRAARGLTGAGMQVVAARVIGVTVLAGLAVFALNQERSKNVIVVSLKGVPIIVPIIVALLIGWTFVLHRTKFGRHIYAVGGSQEAARRAGIKVDKIRISAFVICSTMAAIGGIVAASRGNSVDPNTGGSDVLLKAVGAAVIGGTSLFGGRGRILDAILGGAVIAVIDNGMGLMGYSAGVKLIVTGSVLLLAAGVDAVSRKQTAASR
ncbi:MAG: ABC transporter permease [Streptosporangiaceae bacterium]